MESKFSASVVEFVVKNPNLTYREIGEHFGIDAVTVYAWTKKAGVKKPKCKGGVKASGKLPKSDPQATIVRPYKFGGIEKNSLFEFMLKTVNQ
jgi:hypothetical protein